MRCAVRMAAASLAGGLAMGLAMFLTFQLVGFGSNGDGILLDPRTQSAKVIAVWTSMDPKPRIIESPVFMQAGFIVLAAIHAAVYRSVAAAWPQGILPRALRFAGMLFGLTFLFWEFFTPFNLFGEPPGLIALELLFWAFVALSEGFAIVSVVEFGSPRKPSGPIGRPASGRPE